MTKWLPLAPVTDRPGSTQFLQYLAAQERAIAAAGTGGGGSATWGGITGTLSAQTDLQAALTLRVFNFASRAAFVTANTALPGLGLSDGQIVTAGGLEYRRLAASTATPGLSGWVPNGIATPQHYGALGNGVFDDRPAFVAMNAAAITSYIPKPPVKYTLSSPLRIIPTALTIDPSVKWADLTDSGKLTFWRGRATDTIAEGSNIHRFADRVFIGYAASQFAGDSNVSPDGGTSWLANNTVGPFYIPANAGVVYMSGQGGDATLTKNQPIGFAAAIRSSDVGGNVPIGFGSVMVHDTPTTAAWAGISEVQRESGAGSVYGWEMAVKNKGSNATATPNSLETGGPTGAYGLWLQGGGDAAFGGSPTAPSTAGIAFLGGASTWNSGIVFARDSITASRAIDMSSETTAGNAHSLNWFNAAGNQVFALRSSATTDTSTWTLDKQNDALRVTRAGTNLFSVTGSGGASFVNGYQLFCGVTGVSPQIVPTGPDANLDVHLTPKGTGLVRYGTFTAAASGPVTGYIEIKDAGGTTRRLGVVTGVPGSGGGTLSGVATVTVPNNRFEWEETVTATGVTAASRIFPVLAPHDDADENDAEMLDVAAMSAVPGTDVITLKIAFATPAAGPIKINWMAA